MGLGRLAARVFLVWAVLPAPVLAADEDAQVRVLLQRMVDAVRELDYEGTFVYLQNNQLEAMRVEHRREGEGVRDRLLSLNGSAREVVRDADTVTCILPDSDSVLVDRLAAPGGLSDFLPMKLADLEQNYRLRLIGEDRVAGRSARVVSILPQDNLRYGYRLYLDTESFLPLKSDLLDETGQPVEQTMFTSLSVDAGSLQRLAERPATEARPRQASAAAGPADEPLHWAFSSLPKGFRLDLHSVQPDPRGGGEVEHFLLSDGLASLSVFVEQPGGPEGLLGGSQMGAISAWGGQVEGRQVTVVGEVPLATVRRVLQGLQPRTALQ